MERISNQERQRRIAERAVQNPTMHVEPEPLQPESDCCDGVCIDCSGDSTD